MTQPMTVRQAREEHDPPMTQEQLAARSGVDQTYISLIERCLRTPSDTVKQRLAQALGVAPSTLRFTDPAPEDSVAEPYDRAGHASSAGSDRRQHQRRMGERRQGEA